MTVAAGFRFADGLLICADSRITYGTEFKSRGSKIFPYRFKASGNKAIFTFSGDVAHARMCIQKAGRALADSPSDSWTLEMMHDTLAEQVHEFHDVPTDLP